MIHIVMGKPGVGKSTYLAYKTAKSLKQNRSVYSNVYIEGAYKFQIQDLGKYNIESALVIIDEAGFEFNARDFKKFTNDLYRFFTMHRHYDLDIILAVQFWDRLDIVIRELTHKITVVKPFIINKYFMASKDIKVKIAIDENTKQIIEEYSWDFFSYRIVPRWLYWKYFNSFYRDYLPEKQYKKYINPNPCPKGIEENGVNVPIFRAIKKKFNLEKEKVITK